MAEFGPAILGLILNIFTHPPFPAFPLVEIFIKWRERVAIRTKQTQIRLSVVFRVSIYMIDFQRNNTCYGMFFSPATLRTSIPKFLQQIFFKMRRDGFRNYPVVATYPPVLPCFYPFFMLILKLAFIRTEFNLMAINELQFTIYALPHQDQYTIR
jgi:hypothetical protein